jgi:hypothetical protein
VRNLMGLTLVLIGIFLMFIPSNRTQQDEGVTSLPAIDHPDLSIQEIESERGQREEPFSARSYARKKVSEQEFYYLDQLVALESSWNHKAKNPVSSAYGLGQFIDQTWEEVGYEKTDNYFTQIDAMIDYVQKRYGSFEAALTAWYERKERTGNGWY